MKKNVFTLSFAAAFSFSICLAAACQAQEKSKPLELPQCDIFLFDIETGDSESPMKVSNPRNITDRIGYDNQPWFTPESKTILFTANRAADRTDIFEYVIESKETRQITDSPTQEYSPQISPENKVLSFVTDGEGANQSIWSVKRGDDWAAVQGTERWLLQEQGEREPVGYYSWNHETDYILFWSRYGYSIRLFHAKKKVVHFVTGMAPPSSPYIIPGTNKFSFLHRQANDEAWIKELDPETLAIRPLTKTFGSNPNYGWTPDGSIIMCDGTKMSRWSPDSDGKWSTVVDLATLGMKSASRVAVSPNGKLLAVVGVAKDSETN
ncbi:MAG: TolB family protein [Mariniblastus sp.]